jgi:hypothetical protein
MSLLTMGTPPARARQAQRPSIEPTPQLQRRFQDTFESARKRSTEFSGLNRQPTRSNPAQGRVQQGAPQAVASTSPRAQPVKQAQPTYKAFWKDSQDFGVRAKSQPTQLNVPQPPRFGANPAKKVEAAADIKAAAAVPEKKGADSLEDAFKALKAAGATGVGGGNRAPNWLDWITQR